MEVFQSDANNNSQNEAWNWLIRLRWSAVASQALLLLLADKVLHLSLPYFILAAIVFGTAITNLVAYLLLRKERGGKAIFAVLLALDVGLLTALLGLSGGAHNPFTIFYLVHVVLAALFFKRSGTLAIAALCAVGFATLFLQAGIWGTHLTHDHSGMLASHIQGMWFAFLFAAISVSIFLSRILSALQEKESRISQLAILSAHQQRLASLTTLAANAAHELNTPLGSIALAAGELERAIRANAAKDLLLSDTGLIRSEVSRCSQILARMAEGAGDVLGEPIRTVLIRQIIESALEPHLHLQPDIDISGALDAKFSGPIGAVVQALSNVIKNAVEASLSKPSIAIHAREEGGMIRFVVRDQGHGMDEPTLARLGEPFFTTKALGSGLGLGVFLAKLTAESLGGSLRYQSRLQRGTTVEFTLQSKADRVMVENGQVASS